MKRAGLYEAIRNDDTLAGCGVTLCSEHGGSRSGKYNQEHQ